MVDRERRLLTPFESKLDRGFVVYHALEMLNNSGAVLAPLWSTVVSRCHELIEADSDVFDVRCREWVGGEWVNSERVRVHWGSGWCASIRRSDWMNIWISAGHRRSIDRLGFYRRFVSMLWKNSSNEQWSEEFLSTYPSLFSPFSIDDPVRYSWYSWYLFPDVERIIRYRRSIYSNLRSSVCSNLGCAAWTLVVDWWHVEDGSWLPASDLEEQQKRWRPTNRTLERTGHDRWRIVSRCLGIIEWNLPRVRNALIDVTPRLWSRTERDSSNPPRPNVLSHLRGGRSCFPVAFRMQSTRTFDSLFEHLKTTTGAESLLMEWLRCVPVPEYRSSERYMNMSFNVSGVSDWTQVGSRFSNGIVSAVTYCEKGRSNTERDWFTCVRRSTITKNRSATYKEHGLLIKLWVCSFWRSFATTSDE